MPRKKKIETAVEQVEDKDLEAESAEADEFAVVSKIEKKQREKSRPKEEQLEEAQEVKTEKKKEVKILSEKELKRVMTDTKETLVPLTDYIRCSMHLGTKVITPDMRRYVYKRRADGLAVINTNLLDVKLREAIEFLKQFEPQDLFIACKREAGWQAVKKFAEVTGIRSFTKKYPAGIITNLDLDNFFEVRAIIICDPWVDKNALCDAVKVKIPVLGICDTNNYTKGVTKIIAGNNKSGKSIGLALYILAREYLKNQGKTKEAKALILEDFTGKLEEQQISEQQQVGYGV